MLPSLGFPRSMYRRQTRDDVDSPVNEYVHLRNHDDGDLLGNEDVRRLCNDRQRRNHGYRIPVVTGTGCVSWLTCRRVHLHFLLDKTPCHVKSPRNDDDEDGLCLIAWDHGRL